MHTPADRGTHHRPTAPLPGPRGELTGSLLPRLGREPHDLPSELDAMADDADEEELHLALYCLYELHYRGFPEVPSEWEWEPSLLRLRRVLEHRFEANLGGVLGGSAGAVPDEGFGMDEGFGVDEVVEALVALATGDGGPSLSEWVRDHASLPHLRELFKHRTAYQLKEADPHTWAIPRLEGRAKAVLTAIQADEYGNGRDAAMHSTLFERTLDAVGLDSTPNAYLDQIPGWTLATTNLISLFGLHRRLRGCLVGHLALFEMTSIGPMGRYAAALQRLGLPAGAGRFFEVHVEADEIHQRMATDGMVAGFVASEPALAGDVLFGARALTLVEQRFTASVLGAWTAGRSSLRPGGALPSAPAVVPAGVRAAGVPAVVAAGVPAVVPVEQGAA